MSKQCREQEAKFANIETKLEKKIERVNILYSDEVKLLNEKFNIDHLKEKYSNGLNSYRQDLLNQIMLNLRSEIDKTNEALNNKDVLDLNSKNFVLKLSMFKSNRICVWKLLLSEIKFEKKF